MLNLPKKANQQQILIFALDEPRYALYLSAVERVIRAVETTPLPNAPQFVLGVINMQGQVIPVVDIRPCFGMPKRVVTQNDRFILTHTSRRVVALVADSVSEIHELADQDLADADKVIPGAMYIHGLVKVEGDLILLCDIDQFLTFDDEKRIVAAIKEIESKATRKTRRKAKAAV